MGPPSGAFRMRASRLLVWVLPVALAACGAANPVGLDLYNQLISCVVCDACPVSCSQYAQACP